MEKFRKFWMVYTTALVLVTLVVTVVQQVSIVGNYYVSMVTAAVSLGGLYAYYRCAYKKPGTKYLMFVLIVAGLGGVFVIYRLFTTSPFPIALDLQTLSTLIWYALTVKMYTVNRALAKQI